MYTTEVFGVSGIKLASQEGKCTTAVYGDHEEGLSVKNTVWSGDKPEQTTTEISG